MYDKIYIGSNLLNLISCKIDLELKVNSVIIEKRDNLGGAWQTINLSNGVLTELGGHIFYKNRAAFRKLNKMKLGKLVKLSPQPSVLIGEMLFEDDKMSYYLKSGGWRNDNLLIKALKLAKYSFENAVNGEHFYFKEGSPKVICELSKILRERIITDNVNAIFDQNLSYGVKLESNNVLFTKELHLSRGCKIKTILGTTPRYDTLYTNQAYLVLSSKLKISNFLSFGIPTYAKLQSKKSTDKTEIKLIRITDLTSFSTGLNPKHRVYCCSVACSKSVLLADNFFSTIFTQLVEKKIATKAIESKVISTHIINYELERMHFEDYQKLLKMGLDIRDLTDMAKALGKYL